MLPKDALQVSLTTNARITQDGAYFQTVNATQILCATSHIHEAWQTQKVFYMCRQRHREKQIK